jgi:hypothetical protein
MSYNSDSDTDASRNRSWSDVSDLVIYEVGKQNDSCNGCILLSLTLGIILTCYSLMIFVTN